MNDNNSNNYSPFMFGQNCYPSGVSNPQSFNPSPSSMNHVYAGQSSRRDGYNVRDCMFWPASLSNSVDSSRQSQATPRCNGVAMNQTSYGMPQTCTHPSYNHGDQYFTQGGNMSQMGSPTNFNTDYVLHTGVTGDYSTGEPQTQAPAQQAPAKAFIQNDKGQIPIPCNMSPQPGVVPNVQPMAAMGYKVQVPQLAPTKAIDFEISSAK